MGRDSDSELGPHWHAQAANSRLEGTGIGMIILALANTVANECTPGPLRVHWHWDADNAH